MIAQGVLPYKYEEEKRDKGMTALAGLPPYLDLAEVVGLSKSVDRHVKLAKGQGWTASGVVVPVVLLNIAGGDCVDDLRIVEGDEGFCELMREVEEHGLTRKQRRALSKRWRKERKRSVPSPSATFRFLSVFHDPEQEKDRVEGKAFIPKPNGQLRGLVKVNGDVVAFAQSRNPQRTATLDMDASLIETYKRDALYSYQGTKAYQPLSTYWAEQGLVLHSEFRDGNVPAGHEQLRVFKEALSVLPEGVKKVRLRSDSAGYQHELLKYCELGENKRFGRIEFAVGCDVTPEFRQAVAQVEECEWRPIYERKGGVRIKTKRQWAPVWFVPTAIAHSKKAPLWRYIAIREPLEQAQAEGKLTFEPVRLNEHSYRILGIVSNMNWKGEKLIHWYYERCGKGEEVHGVLKEDLAGGKLPSGDFGENAAWWLITILAHNLNAIMKRVVLGGAWVSKRMKAIRFSLIKLPARVIEHSRQLFVRLAKGHPSNEVLLSMRRRIAELAVVPGG